MTTFTHSPTRHLDALHPAVAAVLGAASFGLSLTAGAVLDLNSDGPEAPATTLDDVLAYTGLVLAAVVLAVWLGHRARAGAPDRLARYALGLALGSVATFVVFWTGWPHVLGAVAIALAVEHRRRISGFTALSASAAAAGALALTASIIVCLVG
jgi:hypothetical protein